jgi:hypothetical protein
MVGAAAGGGAKAGRQGRVAGHADEGGGVVSAEPVGIFHVRCVEIQLHQQGRFGIAGPDADDGAGRVVFGTSFMMWWSSRDSSNEYSSIASDWGKSSALGDNRVLIISKSGTSPFSSALNW